MAAEKWACNCGVQWGPNKTCPLCAMDRASMMRAAWIANHKTTCKAEVCATCGREPKRERSRVNINPWGYYVKA